VDLDIDGMPLHLISNCAIVPFLNLPLLLMMGSSAAFYVAILIANYFISLSMMDGTGHVDQIELDRILEC
jgi:hypothetical protein